MERQRAEVLGNCTKYRKVYNIFTNYTQNNVYAREAREKFLEYWNCTKKSQSVQFIIKLYNKSVHLFASVQKLLKLYKKKMIMSSKKK